MVGGWGARRPRSRAPAPRGLGEHAKLIRMDATPNPPRWVNVRVETHREQRAKRLDAGLESGRPARHPVARPPLKSPAGRALSDARRRARRPQPIRAAPKPNRRQASASLCEMLAPNCNCTRATRMRRGRWALGCGPRTAAARPGSRGRSNEGGGRGIPRGRQVSESDPHRPGGNKLPLSGARSVRGAATPPRAPKSLTKISNR